MSLKQQQAFEIRFSATDSGVEIVEIQPDDNSQERNVPDPFKKRDKIPRSSGSIEQFAYTNSNINSNGSNNSNNNVNTTTPVRHSSTDSSITFKSKHRLNSDNSRMSSNSDQVSSLKVKSSNAVGPEADKQLQRINGTKNSNVVRQNSLGNDVNALEDDSIIRNGQQSSNKKQRSSSKVDEITGEKEKGNLGKVIPNHQIMDLNGRPEMVTSNNNKKSTMSKTILKNKKVNMLTNNHKDDENKLIPKDGIATPPDTPPRSPPRSPQIPSTTPTTPHSSSDNDQISREETQLATPPLSSSSIKSIDDVSPSRIIQSSKVSNSSRKRRGSQSSQLSNEMPAAKLQTPRSRRLSSASRPIVATKQSQDSFTAQSSNKPMTSQQSSSTPTRSRIPRLSMSSKERPVIAKKVSQGSLSSSSQGSNKFNESRESLSSYPANSKPQTPRGLRMATSRPIINTSLITDVEVESESPTNSNSPINRSPTSYSSGNYSPTSSSHQKKLTISHDDVIIPTVAKKLKMNGQLPLVNYDALLGYSEEPEIISPMTTENGYMDITDQVIDLFDGPKDKSHEKQTSVPVSQQSVRKSSHSRNSSRTHYIVPRKQPPVSQQMYEEPSSPTITQFENSSNSPTFDKRRKSRREEYIMVIRDDDDDDMELIEPRSSVSLTPSEPFTAPTVEIEEMNQEKVEEPVSVQMPVVEERYNPISTEAASATITTSGKIKKDKKKKKQKKGDGDLDDDDIYVRKSTCKCSIM